MIRALALLLLLLTVQALFWLDQNMPKRRETLH